MLVLILGRCKWKPFLRVPTSYSKTQRKYIISIQPSWTSHVYQIWWPRGRREYCWLSSFVSAIFVICRAVTPLSILISVVLCFYVLCDIIVTALKHGRIYCVNFSRRLCMRILLTEKLFFLVATSMGSCGTVILMIFLCDLCF